MNDIQLIKIGVAIVMGLLLLVLVSGWKSLGAMPKKPPGVTITLPNGKTVYAPPGSWVRISQTEPEEDDDDDDDEDPADWWKRN